MSVEEHKKQAPASVSCMVVTISDTRTKESDKSGRLMMEFLKQKGHYIKDYRIVHDEESEIREALEVGIQQAEVEVVLTNGGTGIAARDVTIEVVESLINKEIPGFGELFRMLSYTEDIGSAALLSRAIGGVSGNTAVFSTPGSSGAVKLAMERLILPELSHVVRELKKDL
ncbi:MogA/MoaB family molybdenum cofactor biosynthesis protein [Halobacillus mangrovi]|uniref:MogA/MoaB family molybdenum cofactor biosynthesis protein n=1 Tax=Halobacillus mangrovi TaxID=402384 RepID=UPI003D97E4FB